MSWQLLTAISVLFLSASIILQRVLLSGKKIDVYLYVVLFQALVGIVIGIYAILAGIANPDLNGLWLVSIACVVLYGVGHIFYAKTLQNVDASVFSVLFASHAIWMMLIGVLVFSEELTLAQIIGSALIFLSIFIIANRKSWQRSRAGLIYGLITGVLFGLAITTWTYVGGRVETISWAAWSFIGAAAVALAFRPQTASKILPFLKGDRKSLYRMLLLAIVYGIGSLAMLYAYIFGSLSLVSPLRQVGIIVTVLMALAILPGERTSIVRKIIAALVSFVGAVLIIIG